jgi:hypothetical protein
MYIHHSAKKPFSNYASPWDLFLTKSGGYVLEHWLDAKLGEVRPLVKKHKISLHLRTKFNNKPKMLTDGKSHRKLLHT